MATSTVRVHTLGLDAEFGWLVAGTDDIDTACLSLARHRILDPADEDSELAAFGVTGPAADPETIHRAVHTARRGRGRALPVGAVPVQRHQAPRPPARGRHTRPRRVPRGAVRVVTGGGPPPRPHTPPADRTTATRSPR